MKHLLVFLFASMLLFAGCIEYCEDVDCGPNGTCDERTESCLCDFLYEGLNCENESRSKFYGTWNSVQSICQIDTFITDSNTVVIIFDTVMIDQVWTITGINNPNLNIRDRGLIVQSTDINSEQPIGATLVSPSQARFSTFNIGNASIGGRLNFIDETRLQVDFSSDIYLDGNTCRYILDKEE